MGLDKQVASKARSNKKAFLGEIQRIAFRLLLSSCVSECVSEYMLHLWMPGKRLEIDVVFFLIVRNDTGHNL